MMSVGGFASLLKGWIPLLDVAEHHGLEQAAQRMEELSKAAIGTYDYGWPPLAASTLARKSADTPLLETGAMRDSIHHFVDGRQAQVGSDDPKAEWHELGTTKAPPRSFLAAPAAAHRDELAEMMAGSVLHVLGVR